MEPNNHNAVFSPRMDADQYRPHLLGVLALAFICFTGNFLFLQDFGLYEDDYGMALSPANRTLTTEFSFTPSLLKSPPQGRPLLWLLNNIGFNILWKANALSVLYLFVALLTSLNAILLFALLRRHVPQTIAFAACVLFLLYPADTSKQQLMHWSNHVICCTVVLASLYAHMHFGRFASWILPSIGAIFCLLCYEPYFLLFFAFPFYRSYKQSFFEIRPFLFWIPFLLAVFALGMFWRHSLGEGRVLDLSANLATYLQRAIAAPAHGAVTVANTMWARPWDVLKHADVGLWSLGILLFLPVYIASRSALLRAAPIDSDNDSEREGRPRQLWFLAVAGLLTFLLSYPYRFIDAYFPPNVDMGRFSGMHAVGTFGLCVFFAAIGTAILKRLRARSRCLAITQAAICGYLLLLFMFSLNFQRDQYVRSWAAQRNLWIQIADLCPDMADVDAILLNTQMLANPSNALPHTEAFPFYQWDHQSGSTLPHFFNVRTNGNFPKLIHFGNTSVVMESTEAGVRLRTNSWRSPSFWPLISDHTFIELQYENGQWSRVQDPLVIADRSFTPKVLPASTVIPPLQFTNLGKAVLIPDLQPEQRWNYQRFGRFYPKK